MAAKWFISIERWLGNLGISGDFTEILRNIIVFLFILLLGLLLDLFARKVLLRIVKVLTRKTKNFWDDILLEHRVFSKLMHIIPPVLFYFLSPVAFGAYPGWENAIQTIAIVLMILIVAGGISRFLNALNEIYQQYEISKTKSIKGYIQVGKIIIYGIGFIMIISELIGKSPLLLLTGLGAFAAVLMLIFKDPILGLVGGIQLSANDMLRPGDWITMASHGADGIVIDISLTTVKVQNWDKTIITIPTYALVSTSFQNYRGMLESGGRRLKRSISIDMDSIRFCDEEMLKRFRKIQLITDYIDSKENELSVHNKAKNIDSSVEVNGRRQTNIGIFRAYLDAYLASNPNIRDDMSFMVRHLQPTENGLPIEIYVFSKVQEWEEFEDLQANIFDHVLASVKRFDLRVFQNPTGADFQKIQSSTEVPLPQEQVMNSSEDLSE